MAYFRILQKYHSGHMVVMPAAVCHALGWRAGDVIFIHLVSTRSAAMEKVLDIDQNTGAPITSVNYGESE